jgi:rubrerythrin
LEFKDSQTYKNLNKALEGEKLASTTYALCGQQARREGYIQIGQIFDETSRNEREHAEIWWRAINEGKIPDTLTNLQQSSSGENYEWIDMYKEFARVAREEGYDQIGSLFDGVGLIEKHHDYRFKRLASNIENQRVFCKEKETVWICSNCGNVYWGDCAPAICPVCAYPQGYYEVNCENY